MNPLAKRLASLRLKVRFLDGWLGISLLATLILGVLVAEGMLDFWLHLPSLVRAVLLVGLLASSGFIAYRFILRPFSKPCDDLNLALRIEEVYPELNDSLATTVEFLKQSKTDQARVGGSEAMRDRTVQQTIEQASKCDFGRILDRRSAIASGAAACCLLLTAGVLAWMNTAYSQIALRRFVEPFGMHTWTQITVARLASPRQNVDEKWKPVDPKIKDHIAKGTEYRIKVNLFGQMPKKSEAKVEIQSQIKAEKTVALKIGEDKLSASFELPIAKPDQPQTFKFRVLANDGAFPPRAGTWHEVEVLPPPRLTESPRIAVYPPKYTGLKSPEILEPGPSLVKVYAGSTIVLRARADRKLDQAWIEYEPENETKIDPAKLIWLGQTDPLAALGAAVGGQQIWGSFPAKLDADGMGFEVAFQPWVSRPFVLHLLDANELSTAIRTDLTVQIDPVPEVKLVAPRASLTVLPGGTIPFKFLVTDPEFAIKSIFIEYRAKAQGGERFDDARRTVLFDANGYGELIPEMFTKTNKTPLAGRLPMLLPFRAPDLRLRYQRLEVNSAWTLPKDLFREGDLVEVIVCADDFCDVYPIREPGRSHAIELRILSKPGIVDPIRVDLKEIHDEIKKIIKAEEKALDAVKSTRKQTKLDQKLLENFIENGEQPQREVVERTDTLRTKLKGIRETLQNNKLTAEPTYQEATKIQGVLDSIAQSELPRITPKLEDVRGAIAKGGEMMPKTQARLDEAGKLQDSVLKALRELLHKLDPDIRMSDITEKARQIQQKEKELHQALTDINELKKAADDNPKLTPVDRATIKKSLEEKVKQAKADQLELANQTEKLIQEMKEAKREFEKENDPQRADKIDQAIKNAVPEQQPKADPMPQPKQQPKDTTPLNAKMKNVADKLNRDDAPPQAIEQQKDIVQNLEKVIDSLQGKNEDQTKAQLKERQNAEQKIDDIAKQNEKLRQELAKAEKIQDKEERLKQKEEIAAKMEKLQNQIEETRRELARLNEQRAADELKQAADDLEKAQQKLKNGENPDAEQKDAKNQLDRAKNELKQAEEELARELLVKIADQLEGLKIRQIASVERSESLHAKIIQKKSWLQAYLGTMDGNIEAQSGIADETGVVTEKLKDAKVFHSILEKAKKSMDDAGTVMANRRKDRQDGPFFEDNKQFDDDDLKQEVAWQNDTLRHQKQAVRRLEILLDSIKEEIARMDKKKDDRAQNENPKPPDENPDQPPPRPGDGLPQKAELKALRAEQFDLNQRFEDFAAKNPNFDKLDEDQKTILNGLTAEQAEIRRLFFEITAEPEPPPAQVPNEKDGKEGGKK